MDKTKLGILGIGIVIGMILLWILTNIFGFELRSILIGPLEFKLPTVTSDPIVEIQTPFTTLTSSNTLITSTAKPTVVPNLVVTESLIGQISQPTPHRTQTPTHTPTITPTLTPIRTVLIKFSPNELEEWCSRYDNKLQSEEAANQIFIGHYVDWNGSVVNVVEGFKDFVVYLNVGDEFLAAHFSDRKDVETLKRDQSITIICKVASLCNGPISLKDCSFSQ